jgi:hypothetical protein
VAKSKFQSGYIEQARRLADQFNATDDEIATFFGVSRRTLLRWKLDFPEFAEALSLGKSGPDERVKAKLYQRAVGYDYIAEEVFQYQGKIIRAKVTKHVPANVAAGIYWTRNRCRDEFPDVRGAAPDDEKPPGLDDPDPDV